MKLIDIVTSPWAIHPAKLEEIQDIYARHLKGEKIDIAGIESRLGQPLQNQPQGYDIADGVAVIPLVGVMAKRMNLFSQISGGASTELVARDLKAAMSDPEVKAIILEIDSPGGTVDGTSELARLVHNAREQKPVVAWANGMMASAAYWIGSAANQIYISGDTATVGSIGVLTRHIDYSKAEENHGIKTTYLYAGKYKVVGADNAPLSDDDRGIIQEELDYLYSLFVQAVARHRGVDVEAVLNNMAEGRIFTGHQAINAGLVDGVSTLDALITAMSGGVLPDPTTLSTGVLSKAERDRLIIALETGLDRSAETNPKKENAMPNEETTPAEGDSCTLEDGGDGVIRDGECVPKEDAPEEEGGEAAGARAERGRIRSVLAQSIPGCEAMINKMAFDGVTTGLEAAVKVVQAMREKRSTIAANRHADGADLTAVKPSTGDARKAVNTDASPDEQAKTNWETDPALRVEFTSFEAYSAYYKAEASGRVRSLGRKSG